MTTALTTPTFTGEIHPYLADLPMFDDEVGSIAESIREVGLLHPPTLDTEGRLIGGRHRLAACEQVGVDPEFEIYDGDPLAFVLHDNATRKHQTTGQRVAEQALLLHSAGLRKGGRWSYGGVISEGSEITANERNLLSRAGTILDHVGREGLVPVARGDVDLNAAIRQAEQARDAERNRLAEQERLAAEEADAKAFVTEQAPDLATRVDGEDLLTYVEARDLWNRRNREEAARIKAEKAKREAQERAEREQAEQEVQTSARALLALAGARHPEWRRRVREAHAAYPEAVEPTARAMWSPENVRLVSTWLSALANEMEPGQ